MTEGKLKRGVGVYDPRKLAMILAFDPGGTTGWCAIGVKPDAMLESSLLPWENIVYMNYGEISSSHATDESFSNFTGFNLMGENVAVAEMSTLAGVRWPQAAIVLEDFVLDPSVANMGRDLLTPVRLISAFSYAMTIEHESPLYQRTFIQNRSPVKTTITNDRLKKWKLFEPHPRDHIRDATRHAIYFLREVWGQNLGAREMRHKAWPHLFASPLMDDGTALRTPKRTRKTRINPRIEGLG